MLTPTEIKGLIKHYTRIAEDSPDREERLSADNVAKTLRHVLYGGAYDQVVADLIELIIKRSRVGVEEYGTTLEKNQGSLQYWLQHMIEENIDSTLYAIKAQTKIKEQ